MESFLEAWDLICDYCKKQVTDVSYETWFSKLVPISLDFGAGVAIIQAPNEFNKSTIERGFHKCLNDAVQSVFGEAFTYKLITPMEKKEKERVPDDDEYEYTFETFIEGSSNKFACAACRYVAKEPAKNYNPLFIYGNSGLGKTHLIYAIAHEIRTKTPNAKIVYIKGDQFTNELIAAIQNGKNIEFRSKYREADLFLIDDVQFIAGKESTQEEFFHTFNKLYEEHKQIVMTSDRKPSDMLTLEDRLKTRFEWGLLADIQPPDYETRMAILRKKEELEGYNIDNEIIKYIATNVKSNIRELEGALTKIVASSKLNNKEINLELAEEALKDLISPNAAREVTPQLIINVVSEHFGITPLDLIGQKRSKELVFPRQIVMYLCGDMTSESLQNIGKALGGRDHTTIIHGTKKIASELKTDENLKNTIDILKKKINPQ